MKSSGVDSKTVTKMILEQFSVDALEEHVKVWHHKNFLQARRLRRLGGCTIERDLLFKDYPGLV